jgi:predicted Zn finger-like uncharacterized protein
MLLTICPNCTAQFKVQPEQLNVRQGRVMCGRCRHVFNAFQSLSRLEEAEQAREPNMVESTFAPQSDDIVSHPSNSAAADVEDNLFLRVEPAPEELASSSRPFVPMPEPTAPAASAPLPTGHHVQSPSLETTEPKQASPFDLQSSESPSLPAIDVSNTRNPLLVEVVPGKVPRGFDGRRFWQAGMLFLLLVLTVQVVYEFRTALVNIVPELRPTLSQACDLAGCSIPWGRDGTQIEIVGSELIEIPGKASRILLTATLINRAKTKQDLPSLELKLTDNANQVVVGRALQPADYLGRTMRKDEGIEPNAELYVSLTLDNKGKQPASGYGLLAFYP